MNYHCLPASPPVSKLASGTTKKAPVSPELLSIDSDFESSETADSVIASPTSVVLNVVSDGDAM